MSPGAQHILRLRAAMARTEQKLDDLAAALGPDMCSCCVGAAYGGAHGGYDALGRKLERQRVWLRVLEARAAGDKGDLAIASELYGEQTAKPKAAPTLHPRDPFFAK